MCQVSTLDLDVVEEGRRGAYVAAVGLRICCGMNNPPQEAF